jgi:hypothetical protein
LQNTFNRSAVILAKAEIQLRGYPTKLDFRLRGNDGFKVIG